MNQIIELQDFSCPELDVYARLTQAQLRGSMEQEQGIFIAESLKVIQLALDAGCKPLSFLMERRHIEGQGAALLARCPETPVYTADREVLAQLTGYALTRGMLCAMVRPAPASVEQVCQGARRIAVLEGVGDTTNMGAIFRSAAAIGMDGILLSPECCDPLNRRAVRVSMGTVFQIPWAYMEPGTWPQQGMDWLHKQGFATAAMALSPKAISIDAPQLQTHQRLAILLGSEGNGLAQQTIDRCTYTVIIPMEHGVDSLKGAPASAVAFWQLRKRP